MLVDTHTHLFVAEFDADRAQVIARALDAGVEKMLLPNIDENTIEAMHQLAADYPQNCFPMMGLHPSSVDKSFRSILERMEELIKKKQYVGIGETGLDYYWDRTYVKEQKKSLERHIDWAIRYGLPIVLHTRDSFDDTYEMIRYHHNENLKGVFHCFSGTRADALKIIELGSFKLGVGGVFTFKNSKLRDELKDIPLEYLVLETDSPYLTPHPFRGKRNESAYLKIIAERLAEERKMSLEEIEEATSRNAESLFSGIK